MISDNALFGLSTGHLVSADDGNKLIHENAIEAFRTLQLACDHLDIDCKIVSAYRSFSHQMSIWERKWRGELPIRDHRGNLLDSKALTPDQKIDAIMTWSALPGASRHHWGTDIDVYDRASVKAVNWDFQLVPEEYMDNGPCAALSEFLDNQLEKFEFRRPYRQYVGGISAEPWHISYVPVAKDFESAFTPDRYHRFLKSVTFSGIENILSRFDELFERYILNKGATH
jgi:LAS superfamily LD-carboxypeptidase LdcB